MSIRTPSDALPADAHVAAPKKWRLTDVTSPLLERPVSVVAARDIPYLPDANHLQNLNIYLPHTPETAVLQGTAVDNLPDAFVESPLPRYLVHVHGGAWRDPQLSSVS